MASSEIYSSNYEPEHLADLLMLADLAGIKGPGNTILKVIQLVCMGVPGREVHQLLREILAHKARTKRANVKSTSRKSNSSIGTIPENSAPET